VRKSSGIARIERKHCGKALVRIGRDHFCFPKRGTDFRWALLGFPAPPLSGWGPGSLHDAITAGIDGQRNGGFALHLPSTLGCPLWGANVNGNVIGVNTAIFSPSGGSVGIGFDVPADTAKMVVAQLKEKGHVTRGWLGVQIQPVTTEIADSLGLKKAEGAIVDEPQSGSPAAKAGIQSGDVITAVNGTEVKDARDLASTIGTMAPDTSIKLDVVRNGEPRSIMATLAQLPNEQQTKADNDSAQPTSGVPHLGLTVAPARDVSGAVTRAL
jgi:hypothetical protein